MLIDGMQGKAQVAGFKLPGLVATIIQTLLGMASMLIGFVHMTVAPMGSKPRLVGRILVGIVNLGPISFVITILRIIQSSTEPIETNPFIPVRLNPSQSDITFVIIQGILSLLSVCGTLIGGLTVVSLSLCAFLGGQPMEKHRSYWQLRLAYYSLLVAIGGLAQLLLGVYLGLRFGWGPYEEAVHVAVFTVFFPCLSIMVGLVQTLFGFYGWFVALQSQTSEKNWSFFYAALLNWIVTMTIQVMVQPSYGSGNSFDAEGATYGAVYLGYFIMPPWLEYMRRTTPFEINPEDYGLPKDTESKPDALCRVFRIPQPFDDQKQPDNTTDEECSAVMATTKPIRTFK